MSRTHAVFIIVAAFLGTGMVSVAKAGDGYIGIYADSAGTLPCTTVPPWSGTTLYVIAKLEGESTTGISGVEFRIEVENPSGWWFSYNQPNIGITLGNAFDLQPGDPNDGSGTNMAFGSCLEPVNGQIPLGTLFVINITGETTRLFVKRHSTPTNPGYQCAFFTLCDDPLFSKSCMTLTPAQPCSLPTGKPTIAVSENDPVVFTASLDGPEIAAGTLGYIGYHWWCEDDGYDAAFCVIESQNPTVMGQGISAWVGIDNAKADAMWLQAGWRKGVHYAQNRKTYHEYIDNRGDPAGYFLREWNTPPDEGLYGVEKNGPLVEWTVDGQIVDQRLWSEFQRTPAEPFEHATFAAEIHNDEADCTPGSESQKCRFWSAYLHTLSGSSIEPNFFGLTPLCMEFFAQCHHAVHGMEEAGGSGEFFIWDIRDGAPGEPDPCP